MDFTPDYSYNIDYSSAHRSLEDCKITYQCFLQMQNEIRSKYESLDLFSKHYSYSVRSKDIHATTQEFDESNMLYGKTIVFTGTLEMLNRKEAMQLVVNLGGINGDNVTKKTNYLVLGNNDYCTQIKDGKSNKLKKAEELKLNGYDIEIIPENVFYDMIDPSILTESKPATNNLIMTTDTFEQYEIEICQYINKFLLESGQDISLLRCRLDSKNILHIINFYDFIYFKLRGKKKYFSFPNYVDTSKFDLTLYSCENGHYIINDSFDISLLDNILLDTASKAFDSFKNYESNISSSTVKKNLKKYLNDNYKLP